MKDDLTAPLHRMIADFLHHYDCQILRLPQVRAHQRDHERRIETLGLETDPTLDRLAAEIRNLGGEIYRDGGIESMRRAVSGLHWRASRVAEFLWEGIGGEWWS